MTKGWELFSQKNCHRCFKGLSFLSNNVNWSKILALVKLDINCGTRTAKRISPNEIVIRFIVVFTHLFGQC